MCCDLGGKGSTLHGCHCDSLCLGLLLTGYFLQFICSQSLPASRVPFVYLDAAQRVRWRLCICLVVLLPQGLRHIARLAGFPVLQKQTQQPATPSFLCTGSFPQA